MGNTDATYFSIKRSRFDHEPEDQPPHLIDFIMRGRRGAVKAHYCVDRRMAMRHLRDLAKLLDVELPSQDASSTGKDEDGG